ncbi:16S rRNA (uracil(1498)-N(3))-methyltransferase [Microbacterium sp. YY-03]|uniref:16S rRNA (uracil(1498)-N(3))-methyltransferase n=1 Tax=Microbacterium sp. YY-03 TaxID=3421636 RepID=UPI003D18198E
MALHFIVDSPEELAGESVALTGPEAHHAAAVRRVRVGETVTLGDGLGAWVTGVVASVAPKRVEIALAQRQQLDEQTPRIVLVQALAKGDRDERAVEAATELGVSAIVPWQASRSVSRWDAAKVAKGVARWQSIAREASKQAHRAWVPQVSEPVTTAQLAAKASDVSIVVLEPSAERALTALELPADRDVWLVVGPEGGITSEELENLEKAGATLARMGTTVLRTSTAGPAALAALSVVLGRW